MKGTAVEAPVEAHEHLAKSSEVEVEYYPDHAAPRGESATFRHTKTAGHKADLVCAVSGQPHPEYHHVFVEWAFADAIDWATVKGVATGKIIELPVLDPVTDQPTGETFPAEQSLLNLIILITKARKFDWDAFDPLKPETFVDSMANMLPIDAKFHRSATHGIHHRTAPTWTFQAFPRKDGFVFTPDEVPGAKHP